MLMELRRYWLLLIAIVIVVLGIDQYSKALILDHLGPNPGTTMPLLGSWLSFTYVRNTGVAFGMFTGIPHFFTITSSLISIGALYFYRVHLPYTSYWVQTSVALIVGGAIGNIIDRIRFGYVVDFVHVSWFPGIFNIADSAITIGVIMLAGYLLIYGEEQPQQLDPEQEDALLSELMSQDTLQQDR